MAREGETLKTNIEVSIYEIYMEKIRDLLDVDRKDLKIREDQVRGIYVQNLSEFYVSEASEIYSLLTVANKNRIVASTKMNEASSRSHLLFQLEIYQKNTETGSVGVLIDYRLKQVDSFSWT
jgi:kinesin family protein 5